MKTTAEVVGKGCHRRRATARSSLARSSSHPKTGCEAAGSLSGSEAAWRRQRSARRLQRVPKRAFPSRSRSPLLLFGQCGGGLGRHSSHCIVRRSPRPRARSLHSRARRIAAPTPEMVDIAAERAFARRTVAEPAPVPTGVTKPPALAAAPSSTSSPKSLASEIASVDEIKQLLVGGDPSAALNAIAKYRRDYPKPALGPEASVLEVQALTARGDRARAVALAKRFVKMYPSSPHARQFEALLSEAPHDP